MNCLLTFCVGTDATHAEHIETIKQRQYVGVNPDGSFVPGELGMGLVEGRRDHRKFLIPYSQKYWCGTKFGGWQFFG